MDLCSHSQNAAGSNSKNVFDSVQKTAGNIFKQQLFPQNAHTAVSFSSPSLWGLSGVMFHLCFIKHGTRFSADIDAYTIIRLQPITIAVIFLRLTY